MSDVFARITKVSKALNKKADEATQHIDGVEKRLADAGVGVHVDGPCVHSETREVEVNDEYVQREYRTFLCYGKGQGTWGLMLKTCYAGDWDSTLDDPVTEDEVLLRSADRESRIRAIPLIRQLLEEIAQTLERADNSLTKAVKEQ